MSKSWADIEEEDQLERIREAAKLFHKVPPKPPVLEPLVPPEPEPPKWTVKEKLKNLFSKEKVLK